MPLRQRWFTTCSTGTVKNNNYRTHMVTLHFEPESVLAEMYNVAIGTIHLGLRFRWYIFLMVYDALRSLYNMKYIFDIFMRNNLVSNIEIKDSKNYTKIYKKKITEPFIGRTLIWLVEGIEMVCVNQFLIFHRASD
jgi:hypothetical protein